MREILKKANLNEKWTSRSSSLCLLALNNSTGGAFHVSLRLVETFNPGLIRLFFSSYPPFDRIFTRYPVVNNVVTTNYVNFYRDICVIILSLYWKSYVTQIRKTSNEWFTRHSRVNSLDEFILAWMGPNRQKDSLFFFLFPFCFFIVKIRTYTYVGINHFESYFFFFCTRFNNNLFIAFVWHVYVCYIDGE